MSILSTKLRIPAAPEQGAGLNRAFLMIAKIEANMIFTNGLILSTLGVQAGSVEMVRCMVKEVMDLDTSLTTYNGAPGRLRADAERNRELVLQGAKDAFSIFGFDASYHDIARIAQVGVGTVYRRFPNRSVLLEAVLFDIVNELRVHAVNAIEMHNNAWLAFETFFDKLADTHRRYAGMSHQLTSIGCNRVQGACSQLMEQLQLLCKHMWNYGLREDVGVDELLQLAGLFASKECSANRLGNDRTFALRVILDGLYR